MREKRYLLTESDIKSVRIYAHFDGFTNQPMSEIGPEWLEAHEYRPIDMGVRELKEWAFANMEGCDDPEWTLFSTINDAVERYWKAVEE